MEIGRLYDEKNILYVEEAWVNVHFQWQSKNTFTGYTQLM